MDCTIICNNCWKENQPTQKKSNGQYYKLCDACRERSRIVSKRYYDKNKSVRNKQKTEYNRNDPTSNALSNCKRRAKELGVDCTITLEYLRSIWTDTCPIFGYKLSVNNKEDGSFQWNSFSIDRIDNTKGYIEGNVQIISNRANILKRDASIQELKQLVNYLEQQQLELQNEKYKEEYYNTPQYRIVSEQNELVQKIVKLEPKKIAEDFLECMKGLMSEDPLTDKEIVQSGNSVPYHYCSKVLNKEPNKT